MQSLRLAVTAVILFTFVTTCNLLYYSYFYATESSTSQTVRTIPRAIISSKATRLPEIGWLENPAIHVESDNITRILTEEQRLLCQTADPLCYQFPVVFEREPYPLPSSSSSAVAEEVWCPSSNASLQALLREWREASGKEWDGGATGGVEEYFEGSWGGTSRFGHWITVYTLYSLVSSKLGLRLVIGEEGGGGIDYASSFSRILLRPYEVVSRDVPFIASRAKDEHAPTVRVVKLPPLHGVPPHSRAGAKRWVYPVVEVVRRFEPVVRAERARMREAQRNGGVTEQRVVYRMSNNGFRATYSLAYLAPLLSWKIAQGMRATQFSRSALFAPGRIAVAVHLRRGDAVHPKWRFLNNHTTTAIPAATRADAMGSGRRSVIYPRILPDRDVIMQIERVMAAVEAVQEEEEEEGTQRGGKSSTAALFDVHVFSEPCTRLDRPRTFLEPLAYCNERNEPTDWERHARRILDLNHAGRYSLRLHLNDVALGDVVRYLSSADVLVAGKSTFSELPAVVCEGVVVRNVWSFDTEYPLRLPPNVLNADRAFPLEGDPLPEPHSRFTADREYANPPPHRGFRPSVDEGVRDYFISFGEEAFKEKWRAFKRSLGRGDCPTRLGRWS